MIQVRRDGRRRLSAPLPVTLNAIADVNFPGIAGLETNFDAFYVDLLEFARDRDNCIGAVPQLVYRAENFRLIVSMHEVPTYRGLYSTGIMVRSLERAEAALRVRKIEYEWQHNISVGYESLLTQDPGGNWLLIGQSHPV